MITENVPILKIHRLTQAQYDRELESGNLDEGAWYLTPCEEYATKAELEELRNEIASLREQIASLTEVANYLNIQERSDFIDDRNKR